MDKWELILLLALSLVVGVDNPDREPLMISTESVGDSESYVFKASLLAPYHQFRSFRKGGKAEN
jgi:hypothetical protein